LYAQRGEQEIKGENSPPQNKNKKKFTARVCREENGGGFTRELAEAIEVLLRYLLATR